MATKTAATQTAAGAQGAPVAVPTQVFRVGVYETTTPDIDQSLLQTAAAQKLGTFKISPNGWLGGIYCLFEMLTTGNAAAVAYANDNPFSVIQKVTFKDIGNREIFGPLTGYEWFTVNKWGGYFGTGMDPRAPGQYYTVGGAVGSGGSFQFILYLPLEIVHRDTLGEIENKSSSSSYTLEIYIDSAANTYSVQPTTPGTIRLRANIDGYTEPESMDSKGRELSQEPPADGTVQYWTSEVYATPSGLAKYNVQNGIGYSFRNLIMVAYDAGNGTRATAQSAGTSFLTEIPDPTTIAFGKVQLMQMPLRLWLSKMTKWYDLSAGAAGLSGVIAANGGSAGTFDVSDALENGVQALPFNRDFVSAPGDELRNGLLVTKAGNVLQWSGTTTAPLNVHFLANYLVPPGNDAANLRSGR